MENYEAQVLAMKTILTETAPLDALSEKIGRTLSVYPHLTRRDILRLQLSAEELLLHWMDAVRDAQVQLTIQQKGRWLNIQRPLEGPGCRCDPLNQDSALGGGLAVGLALRLIGPQAAEAALRYVVDPLFNIGSHFLTAIVSPMMLLAVVDGILSSGSPRSLDRVGRYACTRFLVSTFLIILCAGLVCVVIAFFITGSFTQQIVYRITTEDAVLYRNVTLYLVAFMEVLIYTALFILIYQMLKKKVTCNLERVNAGLQAITAGDLDTVINVRAYQEFAQLSDDVNATVSTLKHYIRQAEDRMDQELEFARQIQQAALPGVFPARPDFDLYAAMHTAREVGGDFYDFYLLDRYTLVFLIADVSGKGIPGAMIMMRAKTLLKDSTESGRPIDQVFDRVNRKLCDDTGMFLTAWMGRLDLRTGELTYVNAGHNPPLLRRRDGRFEYLRTQPNLVLAGLEDTHYRIQTLQLGPGDALYLYTDGVTEAADSRGQLFGEDRLRQALASAGNAAAAPDLSLSADDRPVGGLGLHMARKMSASIDYRYDQGENRLVIGFDLEG